MNIVQSLDNQSNRRCGEKGHVEYKWSEDMENQIVQFYFQLIPFFFQFLREICEVPSFYTF